MKVACGFLLVALVSNCFASSHDDFVRTYMKLSRRFPPKSYSQPEPSAIYRPGLPGGFQCPLLGPSPTKPTDARFVRPSDIQLVGALGDSLTAGYGVKARTIPGVLQQFRGMSWSAGGDEDINGVLTMPNILRQYNPNVYGFSLGASFTEGDSFYNFAAGGHTAYNLPVQAVKLIQQIAVDKKQNEWKIITMFVGGNDACQYCLTPSKLSPEQYKLNVGAAIDLMYTLPNTIVNFVGPLDMTAVPTLPDGLACRTVHRVLCACAYNKSDPTYPGRISRLFMQKAQELMDEAPYRWPRRDFAVSYHPQFAKVEFPLIDGAPDLSYMAPDCFHLSQKGQEHAGISLWNNMMRKSIDRKTTLDLYERVMICPTEASPYITI